VHTVSVGPCVIGCNQPLTLIAGPCVLESRELVFDVADHLAKITKKLGIQWIFKTSFDKANRTSGTSSRGPGLTDSLSIFKDLKRVYGCPILTDVHEPGQCQALAPCVDVLQIPAFLCRQTDLIQAAAKTGRTLNIKKGQFLAPWDMQAVVKKAHDAGATGVLVCERGVSFGYNTLVSDMRALPVLAETGCPVIFDATHSVQQPGGQGTKSGGDRRFVEPLARAAAAVGVSGFFIETHPQPDQALSDGPNMVPLSSMESLLETLLAFHTLSQKRPYQPFSYPTT
jgi:2-dehydro-3-deoxyphosphooctonate aldolase (KDO 8-P synthase)